MLKFDKRLKTFSKKNSTIEDETTFFNFHSHLIDIEYRPYIGWKTECLKNKHSTPDKVEILYENYKKLFDNKQKVTIFYIIFTVVTFYFIIIDFSLKLDLKTFNYHYNLVISCVMFMLIILPLLVWNISIYLSAFDKNIADIFNCSDELNNAKFSQIKNNLYTSLIIDSTTIFLLFSNLFISIYFIFCAKFEENNIDYNSKPGT